MVGESLVDLSNFNRVTKLLRQCDQIVQKFDLDREVRISSLEMFLSLKLMVGFSLAMYVIPVVCAALCFLFVVFCFLV